MNAFLREDLSPGFAFLAERASLSETEEKTASEFSKFHKNHFKIIIKHVSLLFLLASQE